MNNQKLILEEFGISNLPADEREALIAEFGETIFSGVLQKVWSDLDLDKQDALMNLLKAVEEKPEDDARQVSLMEFLDTQVPDLKDHISREIETFRNTYRDTLGEMES